MDTDNLLIGIGGLILSVLTYFAGVVHTKRQQANDDRERRITRVLDAYVAAAQAGKRAGLHGLVHAGVGELKNDGEIRELMARIARHGQPSGMETPLKGVDAFLFFKIARERNIQLNMGDAGAKLVEELRSKAVS